MRENYTLVRLYNEATLTQGATFDVLPAQAHYLTTVLRKREGAWVRVFNGKDGEWRAEITALGRKSATLHVTEQLRAPQACPDIWLCFAPVRKHRTAFILEKATELGVGQLVPVLTQRTQFPRLNLDKARAQIIEAAEQTERLDIPALQVPQKLEALLPSWDPARQLIFADEAGDAPPAQTAFADMTTSKAALLVGPEGGFTQTEREILRAQDYVIPVSLGPRILRADTAALSLLTLWQAHCGDW